MSIVKRYISQNARVAIDDYYDTLINKIDVYTEEIFLMNANNYSSDASHKSLLRDQANKLRRRLIDEIKKIELHHLGELKASAFDETTTTRITSEESLFSSASKFAFLIRISKIYNLRFNLILIVCNFYLSQYYIDYLE
jgi:hypothetical protein